MLLLIDLSSEFWRNWHATKSGTKAYELTIDTMQWHVDNYERTILCLEGGELLRKERFPDYKAQREKQPEEALDAHQACWERIESWGVPAVKVAGYEADDVIATLCLQAWLDPVRILGNDKDLYQLLTDTTKLLTRRGEIGPEECVRKFGVPPSQMRDWLALAGDTSDNVPGCPHVGPGRASSLLAKFGSIDGIKDAGDEDILSINKVGKKTLESLREWDPTMAVELVTLQGDLELDLESILENATAREPSMPHEAEEDWDWDE